MIKSCLTCTGLCLACISYASTSVDICQEPAEESHLSIAYYDSEEASLERSMGGTNRQTFNTNLQFELDNNWLFGAGHQYTILNIDQLALQTNDHLHTIFFPVHKLSQSDTDHFRFSIAPAISASSNIAKNPSEYTSDALQMIAAIIWDRQLSVPLGLRYGVCGDHRFGKYRVFPVVSVNWQFRPDWLIEFGFPTTQLSHQVTESLRSALRIAPNGNEWYVKDQSLEKHSQLVHEAYMIEWAFDWQAHEHFVLTASVGWEFRSRYELTLLDESRVRLAGDSNSGVGIALAWFF